MKIIKIIMSIAIVVYAALFGFGDFQNALNSYSTSAELQRENSNLLENYKSMDTSKTEALNILETTLGTTYESLKDKNTIINSILSLNDCDLESAKALNIDDGYENELATLNAKEDLLNLDSSVNCIELSLKAQDVSSTLNAIQSLKICVNNLNIDCSNNTITFRVLFANGGAE